MASTNLIVFGTYRNEKERIHASLDQLERLDPQEVILCDGCFDPSKPVHSTDGTYEILQEWAANRAGTRIIEPIRVKHKLEGFFRLLKGGNILRPVRLYTAAIAMIENIYRINQALTFNYMREISQTRKVGGRFMNYDADQFYSDEVIEQIRDICNSSTEYGLLTATERSFLSDFCSFTTEYDTRVFNNMPHRIYENTFVKPTRDNHREYPFSRKYYIHDTTVKKKHLGYYNHYKFRPTDPERVNAGYSLGDRKAPVLSQYAMNSFTGSHSQSIVKFFSDFLDA